MAPQEREIARSDSLMKNLSFFYGDIDNVDMNEIFNGVIRRNIVIQKLLIGIILAMAPVNKTLSFIATPVQQHQYLTRQARRINADQELHVAEVKRHDAERKKRAREFPEKMRLAREKWDRERQEEKEQLAARVQSGEASEEEQRSWALYQHAVRFALEKRAVQEQNANGEAVVAINDEEEVAQAGEGE